MAEWRMAFRAGTNGYDLWPECRRLGVAIIQYSPLDDIELTKFPIGEPKDQWAQLSGSAKTSMRRFIFEMKKGTRSMLRVGR